mmetsp:Transcript_8719/g.28950  ORF Transcript_8719/g.28950 Transcript_8719/m.28950 type:complete len:266 (-) Transcript_8719:19-816(-)
MASADCEVSAVSISVVSRAARRPLLLHPTLVEVSAHPARHLHPDEERRAAGIRRPHRHRQQSSREAAPQPATQRQPPAAGRAAEHASDQDLCPRVVASHDPEQRGGGGGGGEHGGRARRAKVGGPRRGREAGDERVRGWHAWVCEWGAGGPCLVDGALEPLRRKRGADRADDDVRADQIAAQRDGRGLSGDHQPLGGGVGGVHNLRRLSGKKRVTVGEARDGEAGGRRPRWAEGHGKRREAGSGLQQDQEHRPAAVLRCCCCWSW